VHSHPTFNRFFCSVAAPLMLCAVWATAQAQPPHDGPAASERAVRPAPADQVRGLLVSSLETTLSSAAAGRITQLNATLGASFAKGQTLIAFDCDEPVARRKMAQAELSGAQETLEARVRMQGLEQASDVEVALAAAAVNKSRAQIDLYQAQIGQCTIKAPWAGRVAKVHVKNFMSVSPSQPLLDLVMSGPLKLKLNVPSKHIARVRTGGALDVTIDETAKTYEARIHAVNSRVDPVSQTVEVEATITKSHPELLPGMSGVANLTTLR